MSVVNLGQIKAGCDESRDSEAPLSLSQLFDASPELKPAGATSESGGEPVTGAISSRWSEIQTAQGRSAENAAGFKRLVFYELGHFIKSNIKKKSFHHMYVSSLLISFKTSPVIGRKTHFESFYYNVILL